MNGPLHHLVALILFVLLAHSSTAAAAWPVDLEPILSAEGPCEKSMAEMAKTVPDRVTREIRVVASKEVCRLLRLKIPLQENPAQLCPGVTPATYTRCVSQVLSKLHP